MQLAFNKPVKIPSWAVVSFTDPHRTGHDLEVRSRCCPGHMKHLQQGGNSSVAQAPSEAQETIADSHLAPSECTNGQSVVNRDRACWRRCATSWRAATWTSPAARCHPSPGTTRPALSVRSCTSMSSADTIFCSGVLSRGPMHRWCLTTCTLCRRDIAGRSQCSTGQVQAASEHHPGLPADLRC